MKPHNIAWLIVLVPVLLAIVVTCHDIGAIDLNKYELYKTVLRALPN